MTPKRFLIECRHSETYIMDGFSDGLAAVRAWTLNMCLSSNESVSVSELLPSAHVDVRVVAEVNYK